jgi:hypothetical protein
MKEGIKSLDASGNNNWTDGKRADNSTSVVYLFNPIQQNYFPHYGIVLLEIETDNALENELLENDDNTYREYIVDYVAVEKIKRIYIPAIFKSRVQKILNEETFKKIEFVKLAATYYKDGDKVEATAEVLKVFGDTAEIESTEAFNFFRGQNQRRQMIDLYNLHLII